MGFFFFFFKKPWVGFLYAPLPTLILNKRQILFNTPRPPIISAPIRSRQLNKNLHVSCLIMIFRPKVNRSQILLPSPVLRSFSKSSATFENNRQSGASLSTTKVWKSNKQTYLCFSVKYIQTWNLIVTLKSLIIKWRTDWIKYEGNCTQMKHVCLSYSYI